MKRNIISSATAALGVFLAVQVIAQQPGRNLVPLTEDVLKNPSPNDWLMYNRTYDAQRFSPLQQINKSNVSQLKLAWSVTQGAGSQEGIPLVHDGVMYLQAPGAVVQALDATTGQVLWSAATSYAAGSSPAVANGMVYISVDDNNLYAYGLPAEKMPQPPARPNPATLKPDMTPKP